MYQIITSKGRKTYDEIAAIIQANREANKDSIYEGLDSSEIGEYSRVQMFGRDDEAFPSDEEWSAWVD